MRLIDVDALRADYGMADDCKDCKTGYRSCQYDNTYTKMNFCGWLDDAPTVDAVPVVRCKDCEWWTKQDKSLQGRCARYGTYPTGEWFCAAGRKDGDDNG